MKTQHATLSELKTLYRACYGQGKIDLLGMQAKHLLELSVNASLLWARIDAHKCPRMGKFSFMAYRLAQDASYIAHKKL